MKPTKSHWWLLACMALFIYACDVINKDGTLNPTAPKQGTMLFTTPKNGVVINLLSMKEYQNATGFAIARQPGSGRVSFVKDATLLYTPDTARTVQSDYFLLRVNSGDSTRPVSVIDTVTIRFVPPDSSSCRLGIAADGYVTQPGKALVMHVLANDRFCRGTVDSTSLQITKGTENGTLSIQPDRRIVYTPKQGFEGYDFFIYKVCSKNGQECGEAPVRILVQKRDSSQCPGAQPDNYTFIQDSSGVYTLDLLANDRFCTDSINRNSVRIVMPPRNGRINIQSGNIFYQYNAGFVGGDSFRYRVCSNSGHCSEADVRLSVQACTNRMQNDTLTYRVTSARDSIYRGGVAINMLQNDQMSCPVTAIYAVTITKQPDNGQARIVNNRLIYTPNAGYKGRDTVQYGLCVIGNSHSCQQRAVVYIDIR